MKTKVSCLAFSFLTGLALVAGSTSISQAAIVVVLPTATVAGKIEFTQDINFFITVAGTLNVLVFDEWVTSDGTETPIYVLSPNGLSYSLNGGSPAMTSGISFYDNLGASAGNITPNDGYLYTAGPALVIGDVFTIKAAIYTIPAGSPPPEFNLQAGQTFTGNMFLTNNYGSTLNGAVPEPSAALLGAIGALGLLRRRRLA